MYVIVFHLATISSIGNGTALVRICEQRAVSSEREVADTEGQGQLPVLPVLPFEGRRGGDLLGSRPRHTSPRLRCLCNMLTAVSHFSSSSTSS
jgi:hypothetical protein